jgi:hypothetical protein
MYVTAEAIKFGDRDGALELLSGCESGLELRAAVERVGALARLNLNELTNRLQTLHESKLVERLPLGLDAET